MWAYIGFFFLSIVKFIFTPAAVRASNTLTYIECLIVVGSGALLGGIVFFYSASYFMKRAHDKRVEKEKQMLAEGKILKKFTRVNKFLVRTKRSLGIIGVALIGPLLMIPIGGIVMAKFYGTQREAILYWVGSICIWTLALTSLAYLF